jgi:hypothetical protein
MARHKGCTVVAASALWSALAVTGSPLTAQILRGTVADRESGRPVVEALVLLLAESGDTVAQTLSDPSGSFSLTAPGEGAYLLEVATLGYRTVRAGLFDLGAGGEMTVAVRLTPEPIAIPGLAVDHARAVREPSLVRNGFFDRLSQGVGHFITPVDLERSSATRLTDVLARVPFLRVVRASTDRVLVQDGGSLCAPAVLVDGILASTVEGRRGRAGPIVGSEGDIEGLVALKDVEAVEVYRGGGEIPGQFAGMVRRECGAIIIWTKRR